MTDNGEDDLDEGKMSATVVNGKSGLGSRTLSGSFTRSRKNSRIATVKPVTKCSSSSEEDITKAGKIKDSTSPRIARLLSKDMASLDKDVIVAELEKCLSELESNDSPYTPLTNEYKRMEEERDELAKELENAFGDLEGYMLTVREVESERKAIEADRDELAKEVEYLKYCLTHRQEVEENSLKLGKETLEVELKEVKEENQKMKDQISELLEERQSLIESLLNLHSNEVDDVIQTRSRSCSVVSTDSSTSALRSECMELRDRIHEAEEAEIKVTAELSKCKEYLEETLKEKNDLEKRVKGLNEDLSRVEEENDELSDQIEKLDNETKDEIKAKDESVEKLKMEVCRLQKDIETRKNTEKAISKDKESNERNLELRLKNLEQQNLKLKEDLRLAKKDFLDDRKATEKRERELKMVVDEAKQETEAVENENKELKVNIGELKEQVGNLEELRDEAVKVRKEKDIIENQMAEIGEKLLSERSLSRKQKADMQIEIDRLSDKLKVEEERRETLLEKELNFDNISEEVGTLKNEKRKLEAELRCLKKIIEKNNDELNAEKSELQRRESDLCIKQQELTEAKKNVEYFKKELERSTSSKVALQDEKSRIESELEDLRVKLDKGKDVFHHEKSDLKLCVKNLESQVEVLKRHLDKVKEELLEKKRTFEKSELEKQDLKQEMDKMEDEFRREKGKLKTELKASLDNAQMMSRKLEDSAIFEEKLRQSNYSKRELEQSLSDAMKEKKDIENEASIRIDESNTQHENEKEKLKEEISQLRSKLGSGDNSNKEILRLKSKTEDLNIFIERAETKVKELETELKYSKKQASDSEDVVNKLRKEKNAMQIEVGNLRSEVSVLKSNLDKVTRQLRNACADVEKAINEKKLLKEQLEYSKFELENVNTVQRLNKESEENIMSEKVNSQLQKHEELRNELHLEIAGLKEEQIAIENDLKETKAHLEQAQDKELRFMHSIDGLSENIERLRKDKNVLERALESSRNENKELSAKLQKMSQPSIASSQESKVLSLDVEKEELKRRYDLLQDELAKAHTNYKMLLDKVRSSDETNANALRSLKARKSELQMQLANVQHEKEDLEKEVRVLKEQLLGQISNASEKEAKKTDENEVNKRLEMQLLQVTEKLNKCQARVTQLEEENRVYKQKLQESEELISDLQKAVARANDVAMEKALEISRHKRIFEKKFEKVLKENFGLRKQLYIDGSALVESEKGVHSRSFSDLSPTRDQNEVTALAEVRDTRPVEVATQRKKSAGELHKIVIRDIEKERGTSISRSGSAPITQREFDMKPVKTKITAASVTPPVKYISDTDSIGSKPDSNDGDNAPPSPGFQKPSPPTYEETSREHLSKEQERKAIAQPNKIHRPILLKEIKFPSLSPAVERREMDHSQNRRSPVMRSQAMRSPGRRSPVMEREKPKQPAGKERMEHWV